MSVNSHITHKQSQSDVYRSAAEFKSNNFVCCTQSDSEMGAGTPIVQTNVSCVTREPLSCPTIQSVLADEQAAANHSWNLELRNPKSNTVKSWFSDLPLVFLYASCFLNLLFAIAQLITAWSFVRAGNKSELLSHHIILAIMVFVLTIEIMHLQRYPTEKYAFRGILLGTTVFMLYLMGLFTMVLNFSGLWLSHQIEHEVPKEQLAMWVIHDAVERRSPGKPLLLLLLTLNILALVLPTQSLIIMNRTYKPTEPRESIYSEGEDEEFK